MSIVESHIVPPLQERGPIPPALLRQYGCGPVQFSGSDTALFERHLLFDNVLPLSEAGMRQPVRK